MDGVFCFSQDAAEAIWKGQLLAEKLQIRHGDTSSVCCADSFLCAGEFGGRGTIPQSAALTAPFAQGSLGTDNPSVG